MAFDKAAHREMGLTWKDLLSGLDPEPEERDEEARNILAEVGEAGIVLSEQFDPREIKRVSGASRRGDKQRRKLVREYAGTAVQTLSYRLEDAPSFYSAVQRFLTIEEPDALRALYESEKSRTEPSTRLTAFLLLDTAIDAIRKEQE